MLPDLTLLEYAQSSVANILGDHNSKKLNKLLAHVVQAQAQELRALREFLVDDDRLEEYNERLLRIKEADLKVPAVQGHRESGRLTSSIFRFALGIDNFRRWITRTHAWRPRSQRSIEDDFFWMN